MRYQAVWTSYGEVTITEYEDDAEPESGEIVFEDRTADITVAAQMIKEQGFGFTDMWTRNGGDWDYKAPLKAMEPEDTSG